jgi:hypothetical protein
VPFKLGGGLLGELSDGRGLESWGVVARVIHMLANMVVARIGVAGGGVGCVGGCANVEEEVSGGHCCARSRDQDASVAAHSVPFVVGECMEGWGWGVIFLIGVVAGVFHKWRRGVAGGAWIRRHALWTTGGGWLCATG